MIDVKRMVVLIGAIGLVVLGSSVGSEGLKPLLERDDIRFPHEMHFNELEIGCESCHHDTAAAALKTPHPEYFEDFWINCATCHKSDGDATVPAACSTCHHDSPRDVADETLSSKVVIHQSCWQCHEVGQGTQASSSCGFCHDAGYRRATRGRVEEGVPSS